MPPLDRAAFIGSLLTLLGRALNGWTLLAFAVALLGIMNRHRGRAANAAALRSLGAAVIAVGFSLIFVGPLFYDWDPVLVVGLRASTTPGKVSLEATGLAAGTGVLVASYGWRMAWLILLPVAGAVAQIMSADHVLPDVAQGWLFGSGCALLIWASNRPISPQREAPAQPDDSDRAGPSRPGRPKKRSGSKPPETTSFDA